MFLNDKEDFFCDYTLESALFGEECSSSTDLFDLNYFGNTTSMSTTERNFSMNVKDHVSLTQDFVQKPSLSEKADYQIEALKEMNISYKTDELLAILQKELALPALNMFLDTKTGEIVFNNQDSEGADERMILQPEPRSEKTTKDSYNLDTLNNYSFKERTRFSKKHDREMFKILQELCDQHCISITCFYDPERVFSRDCEIVLNKLIEKIKWRSSRREELLNRICKIASDVTFSVRDGKLLRKLIKSQQRKGDVDCKALLYYFPGKTIELLEQECDSMFAQK